MSGKIALTATPFDLDGFSDCRGIKDRQSQKFFTLYMKRCGCGSYLYKIIESGWSFQQFSDQSGSENFFATEDSDELGT